MSEKNSKEDLAKSCAMSIYQWLKSAVQKQAIINNEILQAKNIAVLVRNIYEADLIRNELQELGIPSVYLSDKGNVFNSQTAQDLILVLTACLNPFNERNILNAISTALFCQDCANIYNTKQNETYWEETVARFINYRYIWQQQGILVMLHQLLFTEKLSETLLSLPKGERIITDFLHLSELLQQASITNENEAGLLHWFKTKIKSVDQFDENIRLESERELVKIVTIHKSKGLAYDIVWLPFIGISSKEKIDDIATYYSEQAESILWDIDKQNNELVQKEKRAEEMRLLYVALTRAKYQIVLGLPKYFDNTTWNSLLYALTQGNHSEETTIEVEKLILSWQNKIGNNQIVFGKTDNLTSIKITQSKDNISNLELLPATFTNTIEHNWMVTSFTNIVHKHEQYKYRTNTQDIISDKVLFDEAKDYDIEQEVNQNIVTENFYPLNYSPFDLPCGAKIGTELHYLFEKIDFTHSIDKKDIMQICHRLQLDESWIPMLAQWLNTILDTPLTSSETEIKLNQITAKNCIKEMPFYLKLKHKFDVKKFNEILNEHHHLPSEKLNNEGIDKIQGMLRGFIDLVIRHNGRYYLIDYKSNFLGKGEEYYSDARIKQAMIKHHYDWQYLFYSLALHRYLTQRDSNYQYEKNFGGVIYLFLRGMNGINNNGIYFDKPHHHLIEKLEDLF